MTNATNADAPQAPMPVCILGAPRSGTSLTTRVLNACGLYLGPSEELAPPGPGNRAGFWELRRAVRLNERILLAMGGSRIAAPHLAPGWEDGPEFAELREDARELIDEVFGGHRRWGWKDPRNSFTLPFWQLLLPSLRHVICVRNPLDVKASGSAFAPPPHEVEPRVAIELWERYMASAVVNTSGRPRLFVSYEDYFEDWRGPTERLARFAALDDGVGVDEGGAIGDESRISNLIDDGLRHHRSSVDEALESTELPESTRSLYLALQQPPREQELDRLAHRLLGRDPDRVVGPPTLPGTTDYAALP
jgi:hypothetical protein